MAIYYLKEKYHWYINHQKLKHFFKTFQDDKVLLFGYPKSGNTWLRFILFNYRNLILNPSCKKTLTYKELNTIQNNVMDRGNVNIPKKGYPIFYRTHQPYSSTYLLFKYKIYIHRNPLDTLISAYYFYKKRDIPFVGDPKKLRNKLLDIDFYVSHKLQDWISYHNKSIQKADFIISYTDLKTKPLEKLEELINILEWNYNEKLLIRSIKMSDIKNIKKMGEDTNQQYGNGPKDGSFKGQFIRSGEEGQYYKELKPETIQYIHNQFPDVIKNYKELF